MEFRLPDAGEGLTEAEIVTWRVQPGDSVKVNDPLVEVETAKSLVELPSPVDGVIEALLVSAGDLVAVGTPIIWITETALSTEIPAQPKEERQPVLVGYGPRTGAVRSRRMPSRNDTPAPAAAATPAIQAPAKPLAKPPIRKLARDLGIDLLQVHPTGPNGTITRQDVQAARALPQQPVPTQEDARETRTPIRGVRRSTAAAMVSSAFTAPHVTVWVAVDVTRSMRLAERAKVSPLLIITRALLLAVRRHPEINATWDDAASEIVTKHYVHVGIAAATDRGLLVPVVKDADRLSTQELATELSRVITAARAGEATPADLQGGTITITNIGVFGVDGGTPILPPGQAAILGVGQIVPKPWVHKGKVKPRQVAELTLSFDHRLVDGDLGSRFLHDIAAQLEHPDLALLWS